MQRRIWLAALAVAAMVAGASVYSQNHASKQTGASRGAAFRILMGVGDQEPSQWDGTIRATSGRILGIQGWRFVDGDSTDSRSSWKSTSRKSISQNTKASGPLASFKILETGVIVSVNEDGPVANLEVKTKQGNFSFGAQEVPFGESKRFVAGRVLVERVPDTHQITDSPDEQDFPAIAHSGDSVYVSYVEFVHADPSLEGPKKMTESPKNFDWLARPAGGNQVFLLTYSKSKGTWSAPVAVSAPKQDIVRTAVAVDGQKRVWVFWAANKNGNFDIYAKSLSGSRWSSEMRLTSDAGTDLNPVAATDAKGRVWVAWQGFRKDNLEILAAVQDGDEFSGETIVSFSPASDWDPSIATAPNGEVAVSWDTYDKGDYDVYFRRLKADGAIQMDKPVPVAASQNFEARSSAAYDGQNRLWVAYEAAADKWGKDFGVYEKSGIALYQGQTVRVKCFQGSQAYAAADLEQLAAHAAPPARGNRKGGGAAKQGEGGQARAVASYSFPRIAADSNGAVFLSYRTSANSKASIGPTWISQILYFDGARWKGPIAAPGTDYWLDVRSAMTMIDPGDLMMISPGDHRLLTTTPEGQVRRSAINSDLVALEMRLSETPRPAQLKAIPQEKVAAPDPDAVAERAQVKLMRQYRASAGGDQVQLLRGEFHRHTEISSDGQRDGPIIDAYRYFIDAASMDWGGCCDHDNGGGREYSWWISQQLTDAYHLGGNFVPMFSYERSVNYPEGHRNVVFQQRGIRVLPRLPLSDKDKPAHAPDTQMLYGYLRQFHGITAAHTVATDQGTDWRDNDPILEPVVEIYQGARQNYEMPGGPRANTADNSISGWEPLGFVSLALKKGYRLGFQASSDHVSTHMSYCNLWVTTPTREGIMDAFHKRRVYGATDDILADVRCGGHFMGEEFETSEPPALSVKLWGRENFAKVHIIKDGEYVYSTSPGTKTVDFVWKDNAPQKGKTSYYYVRGEQSDGELVWVSPMWITYR
jgi:hypothetical protein